MNLKGVKVIEGNGDLSKTRIRSRAKIILGVWKKAATTFFHQIIEKNHSITSGWLEWFSTNFESINFFVGKIIAALARVTNLNFISAPQKCYILASNYRVLRGKRRKIYVVHQNSTQNHTFSLQENLMKLSAVMDLWPHNAYHNIIDSRSRLYYRFSLTTFKHLGPV